VLVLLKRALCRRDRVDWFLEVWYRHWAEGEWSWERRGRRGVAVRDGADMRWKVLLNMAALKRLSTAMKGIGWT
jgi:hypothetical protein